MKKLYLVLISILLLTGAAQAAEYTQAITAELSAQNVGRSRVTDASVILKVWNTTLESPGVGVSDSTSLILYTNRITPTGITIDSAAAALDTVGEVVDYINTNLSTDSTVRFYASVGNDAYRDLSTTNLLPANISVPGATKALASTVANASSRSLSVGVEDLGGMTPRLKSITSSLPLAATGDITISVYDGNTRVWRKYISNSAYNSATANSASANSVTFAEGNGKGLSVTKGNALCVEATTGVNVRAGTDDLAINSISIVYDQYKD